MIIKIGTRRSNLALFQAHSVKAALSPHCRQIEIVPISTSGDRIAGDLSKIGGKGLFIKELEEALLQNKIDIAIHSLKDVPAFYHNDLVVVSVLKRALPNDVFISFRYKSIDLLPAGSVVGTCAPRRIAQLAKNISAISIRGNIETRIKKAESLDGIILAYCALERLAKTDLIKEVLSTNKMLPAVGQGTIAAQFKKDNIFAKEILAKIADATTTICATAERAFLEEVNGDCSTPLAALAQLQNDTIFLRCMLSTQRGTFFTQRSGCKSHATALGKSAALELIKNY